MGAVGEIKARPFLTGRNFSEHSLARIHTHDPTIARVQQNPKRVPLTTSKIGVGPAATLDYTNAIKYAITQDGTALTAADQRTDGEPVTLPIGLRIPVAA